MQGFEGVGDERLLRVMTWNIAEGNADNPNAPDNSAIPLVALRIREQNPDIAFLNEVVNWAGPPFASGMHQVRELMRLTGLPYAHWAHTAALGLRGHKVVAILSRFPLGGVDYYPVPHPVLGIPTGYGIIRTTTILGGVIHHLVSLRFNAHDPAERRRGVVLLFSIVMKWLTHPFIIGGDFNCTYSEEPWMRLLVGSVDESGASLPLRDAFLERPDEMRCGQGPDERIIDFILLRGDYLVEKTMVRCTDPNPSDHVWVVAELRSRSVNR